MRFKLPQRRLWRVTIYLISLYLIINAVDLILVQARRKIRPGYDTTRIVAPTLPDGRIDYLQPLDDRRAVGVTPENNAAVLFLQAIGRSALPSNNPDVVTDRLGMSHLPETGDYLVSLADYCKARSIVPAPAPPSAPASPPAPADAARVPTPLPSEGNISPVMRQWIDASARPLDLLVQASLRPRFFIPLDCGERPDMLMDILLPHIPSLPKISDALLTRAVIRAESNDPAGAMGDVLAVQRLARLVSQSALLIERMEAQQHLELPALRVTAAIGSGGKLSASELKTLAAQLRGIGDLPPIADYLDNERLIVLDLTQALAHAPGRFQDVFHDPSEDHGRLPRFFFRFIPIPWEDNMRGWNHSSDGLLAALRQEPYARRLEALALWQRHVKSIEKRSRPVQLLSLVWSGDFYVSMLTIPAVKVAQKQDVAVMQRRVTEIALALAAFKADHARYPAELDKLIGQYLPSIPQDLFSGSPPAYRPTPTGYTLYSVGPDAVDNAGKGDDIAVSSP